MCFEQLVKSNFDENVCARQLAGAGDENIISNVELKINDYLNNLRNHIQNSADKSQEQGAASPFKGLPKKYHPFLQQVIDYLSAE